MSSPITLTGDQIAQYEANGYLVVPDLLTSDEVSTFLTHEQDPATEKLRNGLSTHLTDSAWDYLARHPNVAGAASQLIDGAPRIVQTMYLAKAPAKDGKKKGGAGVAMHQDTHYLPTEPNTLMACWIAMSDTDAENGGLWVVPGSHKTNLRDTHLNRDSEEHASWVTDHDMKSADGREWTQKFYSFTIDGIDQEDLVPLTVPRGAGVFFTSMTIHGSYANSSQDRARLAFAVHYVRDGSWVQRRDVQETTLVESYSL
ncbi:MAG: phytanoyl-CoA dioxygenase family protein [Candidatus Latescibacteria bacterium]|nr:phytanoyl-CoA dioxygenase family protein [Candidatus Latescibacterota bacterium]